MSKIRIYGDTSGYVDVSAPAVADNSNIDITAIPQENIVGLTYDWIDHSASLSISGTGWGLGNATVVSRYAQIGSTVFWRGQITWGSTSTFGSSGLNISVPVSANSSTTPIFLNEYLDNGTQYYIGYVALSGSSITPFTIGSGSSITTRGTTFTSSYPFTWAAGDNIRWNVYYEAA